MPAVTEPPGRVDVEPDVLLGILALEVEQLRGDEVGDVVVDLAAEEHDAVLEQAVEDVHPLEGGPLLLRGRRKEVALIDVSEATGRTAGYRPRDAAGVAELADVPGLGPGGAIREGSSPSARTPAAHDRGTADGSMTFDAAMGPPILSGTAGNGGIGWPAGRGQAMGVASLSMTSPTAIAPRSTLKCANG